MKRLHYTIGARRDLDEIASQIELWQGDDRLAIAIVRRIVDQCERLAELSGTLGRPREELAAGLRSFPFRGYVIFFRYDEDQLAVLDIVSERRDSDSLFDSKDD